MVKNHHFPYSHFRTYNNHIKRYDNLWKEIFPGQYVAKKGAPGRIYNDGERFLEAFIAAHIAGAKQETCLHFLTLANEFIQTHFRLVLNPGEQFSVELDGQLIPVEGKHTTFFMSVNEWDTAFCLAVLLRDEEHLMSTIGRYKAENYIDSRAEDLPIDYPFCKFLQGLYKPDVDLKPLLQEIVTLSGPEYMPQRRQSYIYNIWLSFIEIIHAVLTNDKDEYEQAIIKALDSHIAHYSTNDCKDIPIGWIALHICTGAAIAYDKCGFKLPISSPYLPEWLIYNEFELY